MREGDVEESTEMRKFDWEGKCKMKCSREESCCRNNSKSNSYCVFSNRIGAFMCNVLVLYVQT
jgi:hypothetical protein